jgi:hypothetical protein
VIRNYRKLIAIKAKENGQVENPQWINVLNTGHWDTNYQGSFDVTSEDLFDMVDNFNSGVRKGIPIDTDHDNAAANGWITQLEVRNASELWALVEWTPLGMDKLANKIYKFLSPEFAPTYFDPETDKHVCDNVLIAAALTNFPLMKGLQPVVANEGKNEIFINAELTTKKRDKMPDSEFAWVDKDGKGHLPINDAAHVRNALARINQVDFDTPEEKEKAKKKIMQKAKSLGVDVDEDKLKENCDKQASENPGDNDSLEAEIDEIHDAFEDWVGNPFKQCPCEVVETHEDENNVGYLIVHADPDFDGNFKYFKVEFKEDEASETYEFEAPEEVQPQFVDNDEEGEVMAKEKKAVKAKEVKEVKAAEEVETPEEAPETEEVKTEETPDEVEEKTEEKEDEKTEEPAGEEAQTAEEDPKEDAKPEENAEEEKVEASEFRLNPEVKAPTKILDRTKATEVVDTVEAKEVEVEGGKKISAKEYSELIAAKESLKAKEAEIAKIEATEKITSLMFSENSFKMATEAKDAVVSFYLELNEQQRDAFEGIVKQIPSVKMFNETGDAGEEVGSGKAAYDHMKVRAEELMKDNPKMNYGQALQAARKENPEEAKLASEYKKEGK